MIGLLLSILTKAQNILSAIKALEDQAKSAKTELKIIEGRQAIMIQALSGLGDALSQVMATQANQGAQLKQILEILTRRVPVGNTIFFGTPVPQMHEEKK